MRFGFGKPQQASFGRRPRIALGSVPLVYAIGDVHGHLDLLVEVEAWIIADAAKFSQPPTIVMLGDYIDRGPDSSGVISHLLGRPPGDSVRYCLTGNHEAAMLDFLADPFADSGWLGFGGIETLQSYGLDRAELQRLARTPSALLETLDRLIPREHVAFMQALPALIETDTAIFVHAGLRPHTPLARQAEDDLIWIRDDFKSSFAEFGKVVVHGHTPREEPLVMPNRIAIDTGAFATGHLTAVRLIRGRPPKLFST